MQSPVVPPGGLPCPLGTWLVLHAPLEQVYVVHAVLVPQSVSVVHIEQWPEPSHVELPPQLVPLGAGVNDGIPFEQAPTWQGFVLVGTSVSSSMVVVLPIPLHTIFLQSPAVCPPGSPIPLAVYTVLHTPSDVAHV
jgi:hypothetical protein